GEHGDGWGRDNGDLHVARRLPRYEGGEARADVVGVVGIVVGDVGGEIPAAAGGEAGVDLDAVVDRFAGVLDGEAAGHRVVHAHLQAGVLVIVAGDVDIE